ncbi:MAG: PAS domain S-box protein [Myxococcales bacterium FL481]|nr:MAG: PAS domain S-box protein [Myxococcales bacterium FL481]
MKTPPPSPALSREVFQTIFDASPDAMVVVNGDGVIVATNAQTQSILGYPPDELVGRPVEVLVPEVQAHAHVHLRRSFMLRPKARAMGSERSLVARTRSGHPLPVEVSLTPVADGESQLVCAAIRDISVRQAQEVALRRADLLLRSAVESFHGGFAVFDGEERMLLCNSTYRSMFGADVLGDLSGSPYVELLDQVLATGDFDHEEGREALRERWLEYHRQPEGAFTLQTGGDRHLRVIERKTSDGGTIATALDVTREMRRDASLSRARARAERASRAKSEFLSSMSHELRTPLNAVLGFTQLLRRDRREPPSARQRDRLDHVIKGGEHLLRLIDEVLDLARIEAGQLTLSPEPVKVADLVQELSATLDPLADEAGITLTLRLTDPNTWVIADRTRLAQILLNFGSNAIKYGKPGGNTELNARINDGRVRIEVSDDGIGIPDKYHDRIFTAFQRAGQETGPIKGTGIGLAICQRLADAMDGRVGFTSVEGRGSTFWVELAQHERHQAAPSPVSETTRPAGSTVARDASKVVYVEDNPSNVALMEDFMADYGNVELIVAPNAELGIDLVRTHQPKVVIMDLHLPGMSGIAATRRLKEHPSTAGIPVIALSAAAMPQDRRQAAAAGFHRYLPKPVQVEELTATLDELL